MRKMILFIFVIGVARAGYAQCIDLETAWEKVISFAPSLGAADAEIGVLEGEAKQVALWPNPVLEVESENLGVDHPSDDVEPPQTTISIEQLVELGGKRTARYQLAASQTCVAYWNAQIIRENAYLELTRTFIEVRAAEERWRIASERLELSENLLEAAKRKVQNGKLSPIQEKRVRIGMMADRLAVREAYSAYEQAKSRLAALWGSCCPDFESVEFDLFTFEPPPCESDMQGAYFRTPDYIRAFQAVTSAANNLYLQKANRMPDVVVMGGYRRYHDSHSGGWVVGVEVPLPLFNRNQGGIKSARCRLEQARLELEEIAREAQERIAVTLEKLAAAYQEAEELCACIMSEAKETLQMTQAGYDKGKFDYIDLLDAQKLLYEVQERYIDLLCEYHLNRAELARLSGLKL